MPPLFAAIACGVFFVAHVLQMRGAESLAGLAIVVAGLSSFKAVVQRPPVTATRTSTYDELHYVQFREAVCNLHGQIALEVSQSVADVDLYDVLGVQRSPGRPMEYRVGNEAFDGAGQAVIRALNIFDTVAELNAKIESTGRREDRLVDELPSGTGLRDLLSSLYLRARVTSVLLSPMERAWYEQDFLPLVDEQRKPDKPELPMFRALQPAYTFGGKQLESSHSLEFERLCGWKAGSENIK